MTNDLVRIVRYNVLDAAGKMSFSQTGAQKDAIVGAGGTVVNVIRLPGYEKPPLITPPPPDIPLVLPPPEIIEEPPEVEVPPVRERVAVEEMLKPIIPPPEEEVGVIVRPDQVPIVLGPPVEEEIVEEVVEKPPVEVVEPPPKDVERVRVEEKLVPVTVVPIPVVPITPELITTEVWTVKIIDPATGDVVKTEKFDNERDAKIWASYQQKAVSQVETQQKLGFQSPDPEITPEITAETTSVMIDPNLVTYMGITMTRDQFEADFPPGTIPDPIVEPAGVPPVDIGKAYEDAMSVIPDSLRDSATILKDRSTEAASAGKPWEGFLNYLGSVAYRGSTAVYDTGTFLIRPELWRQTAQTIGYLLAADEPETRAEHNQRIADFVAGDIDDPTMQVEVTNFLQETVPFTPVSQEYLDEAKEFREAFAAQVAADPFGFAVEIAASVYTGKVVGKFLGDLKGNIKNYGKRSGFDDAFVQQQLDKIRPLSEIDDILGDTHVAKMFEDLPDPQMFRGTDLQPPPGVEAWSADIYVTADPTKVFRGWGPGANKGAWMNKAALDVARDVAAKGGQQVVFLRNPITNQVAGTMPYSDFIRMTAENPIAFAGLGVTITVVDAGGAKDTLDKAVEDGVFESGIMPAPITQNQILVTIDKTTLQTAMTELTKTQLTDIDEDTILNILPKLELDTLTDIVPDLDKDTKLIVLPQLDKDVIIDILPKFDKDTILDVVPELDKDVIVDVLPILDTDVIIDVIQDLDDDTIVAVIPGLDPVIIPDIITIIDTDIAVDVITDLDDDTIIVIIPKLDDPTIQELVPRLEKKLDPGRLDYIGRNLPTKIRRKFKRAMKRRPPRKLPPTEKPEPYRIAFQYATGASETKRVEARTYHEALVVAQEQKQIALDPVEVEVEKLAPGTLGLVEPTTPESPLMGAPMDVSSETPLKESKVKKPKKLEPKIKRERRPGPPPPGTEEPTPEIRVSDDKRRHKKEGEDPRRKKKRKKRVRLVK